VREDAAMVVAIKVGLADDVGDAVPGCIVQQQAANQRLLGLDRMRRQLERRHLRISRHILGIGLYGLRLWHIVFLQPYKSTRDAC